MKIIDETLPFSSAVTQLPHPHNLPQCWGEMLSDTSKNPLHFGPKPEKKIDGWSSYRIPTAFSEPSNDANIDISRKESEDGGARGFGNRSLVVAATEGLERPIDRRSVFFPHSSSFSFITHTFSAAPSFRVHRSSAIYYFVLVGMWSQ